MNRLKELNSAIRTEKDPGVKTKLIVVLELRHSAESMSEVFDVIPRCIR